MNKQKLTTDDYMSLEENFGAHNYHPLPVVLEKGKGVYVWDVDGKKYLDFLSAYSAVNQGHCHPEIVNSLVTQSMKLSLTSRAFHNNQLGLFEFYITQVFGYDKVLPMNTGAEAVETAIKLCRKWGYEKKNLADNQALIVVCEQNFHGRTTTIVSFSSDSDSKKDFGPYTPGFISIPYNNVEALRNIVEHNKNIAGFLVEPIQGEAGAIVPDEGYLSACFDICKRHNILFIADEIQTGLGRTGKMLACDYEAVHPDILILGKALSGGVYPVSCVLADNAIMEVIQAGQHGSTYGGNPIAAAVAVTSIQVIILEDLADNAYKMGEIFRAKLLKICENSKVALSVRGKGLMNALVINNRDENNLAWDICMDLAENGLLAKPTHTNIIRFAPPLVINESQISDAIKKIEKAISKFEPN